MRDSSRTPSRTPTTASGPAITRQRRSEFQDPYRRGVALYRAGRYEDAVRAFEQAEQGKDVQSARYNLGNARFRLGDFAGAAEAYEQVLSAEPSDDDAAHNLALARAMLARLEQAAYDDKKKEEQKDGKSKERQDSSDAEKQPKDDKSQAARATTGAGPAATRQRSATAAEIGSTAGPTAARPRAAGRPAEGVEPVGPAGLPGGAERRLPIQGWREGQGRRLEKGRGREGRRAQRGQGRFGLR